jgi:hypothetical protein
MPKLTPHDPLAELHFQVSRILPEQVSGVAGGSFAHPTMARHLGWSNGSEQPLIICVDQFEELFHAGVGGATQQVHCRR